MQFNFPKLEWSPETYDRLLKTIKDSVEKWDFDSNNLVAVGGSLWFPTPTGKVIQHNLGVLPRNVRVYASDSREGISFDSDTFTAVTTSSITIVGPKAFCRVLMNK